MASYTDYKYRIKRNSEQHEQMQYLIQDLKIFKNYSQLLMLAAIIGYNNKLFVPIKTPWPDGVQTQFFKERDRDIIDFIAYAHAKEQSILQKNDKYVIFESYANGGFDYLVKALEVDFVNKDKNDRLAILNKLYMSLLLNEFVIGED